MIRSLVLVTYLVGCDGGSGEPTQDAARADARPSTGGDTILDPAVLHDYAITMTPANLDMFDDDQTMRVPCDVTVDGVALIDAGCRKKGGIGSVDFAIGKPAFSIQFDEYVPDQEVDGLDRIVLNNAIQDPSLLHEHVTYEVFRRAGIPAHRTAFAVVSLNAEPKGIYVVVEPVDKEFLRDRFGADQGGGNLYESAVVDFGVDPGDMELKNDVGRSRADMTAAATVVQTASDASFAAEVGALIDLDQFALFWATELAVATEDGLVFGRNNYYMYHRPDIDRFVFLPHGQDTVMGNPALEVDYPPPLVLAARVHAIPALRATVDAAVTAMNVPGGANDQAVLAARIGAALAVVTSTTRTDDFTTGDLATMTRGAPVFEAQLAYRTAFIAGTNTAIDCGDGVLHGGEECDDANNLDGDGCDATCEPECFGFSANGGSWRLCPALKDWPTQDAICQAQGGTLAVPASASEAAAMASMVRRRLGSAEVWLGLTDVAVEGTWRTTSGAAAPYVLFAPNEPNGDASENCATLDLIYMRDRACDRDFAALCRMP